MIISKKAKKLLKDGEDFQVREEISKELHKLTKKSAKGEIAIADFKRELNEITEELNNLTPTEEDKLRQGFPLTSVCRADMIDRVLPKEEALKITDEQMRVIAGKMADAYLDCGYWSNLKIITDHVLSE